MSELKAFTFGLGRYTEDGSPCVVAFDEESNPRLASNEKFYLKSEADKEIAEKDKVIADLRHRLDAETYTVIQLNSIGEKYKANLRHSNYKRCLAMAKRCDASMAYFGEFYDDASKRMVDHYYKWHKRWLELAEVFK